MKFKEAIEAYKRTLALDPRDERAKWNLELALRKQEEQKKKDDQKNDAAKQPPPAAGEQEMNAVLDNLERSPKDLEKERARLRAVRRRPPARDW